MTGWLSPRGRVLSRVGVGVLSGVIPPDLVDEAVGDGLAREIRLRSLPSRFAVYIVLGLCLFQESCPEVMRKLTEGLTEALARCGWRVPASTALTGARRRVGETPLESLFWRLASPLSPGRAAWSHICGLLAVAWDGTVIDAEDSEVNRAAFGSPGGGKKGAGRGRYPQLRMVALVACGTRALLGARFGPLRGKGTGERELATGLLGCLRPGMLLLADRGFYSYKLWTEALGTGAHLLWRVKNGTHLPVVRELPDGSWLTRIPDPRAKQARLNKNGKLRRRGSPKPPDDSPLPGIIVRVIAFTLTVTTDDGASRTERYVLVTDLQDWRACPAAALIAGYSQRWAIETGFREFKTYLDGKKLRSGSPDLARQELWAYLVIYQAIRVVIARAAAGAGLDPDRISFTATLNAVRRTIIPARDRMAAALAAAEAEILSCPVTPREGRVCPRAVKPSGSPFPSRNTRTGPISQHAGYTVTITAPDQATHTATKQHKQPAQQQNTPP